MRSIRSISAPVLALATALMLPVVTPAQSQSAGATTASPDDRRFIQIFVQDAAIVENLWIEGQMRIQSLSNGDDVFRIGPVFAFSPLDRLEIGGRIDYIDRAVRFDGSESGLGDTTAWAKWQFFHNPVQFTVGVELYLPTGDEDQLLGTGEFDIGVFGAVRKNLDEAYITGYFGFRNNGDATLGADVFNNDVRLEGDTSIFLGGGVMLPINDRFALSGELRVETERYEQSVEFIEGAESLIDLTAGGYWYLSRKATVRAAIAIGLDDGAPDWQLIGGFAWHY
ncbi:MAG: hypothetical protein E2P03_01600 [Acidobacteria bacterium]|nr:MAG: hypothetical protein E2P03_01600 [Acidobacteriota bacterium]